MIRTGGYSPFRCIIEIVGLFGSVASCCSETVAVLEAFGCVYAHHRRREHGLQFAENRLSKACRYTSDYTFDYTADRIAVLSRAQYLSLEIGWIVGIADRYCAGFDRYTLCGEYLQGKSAADDTDSRLARRSTTATAVVADAIFGLIGIIGMIGTERMAKILVVGTMLIGILDYESYRCAEATAIHYAGQKLHGIAFLAGGGYGRLPWLAAVELPLYLFKVDVETGGHAVDNAAYGRTVTLAEVCKPEKCTEGIHR